MDDIDSKPSQPNRRPSKSQRPLQPDVSKHTSPSPMLGKMAIMILVIAMVVYMYQVCYKVVVKSLVPNLQSKADSSKLRIFKVQKTLDSDASFNLTRGTEHGDFVVDTMKRDAVVAAFKVGQKNSASSLVIS